MTTVFIIGGLNIHYTAADEKFKAFRGAVQAKGYKVCAVDISWRQTTPSQYAKQFKQFYSQHKSAHNIVIGNSFGAVVALITAAELQPDRLLLCSLSPFFKEDIGPSDWPTAEQKKRLGVRRLRDIANYSSKAVVDALNQTKVKTTVMYGEKEQESLKVLVAKAKAVAHELQNARLIEVPKAPHSFTDPAYVQGIVAEL